MTETTHGTDLLAATRFVQAGRLSEATALLQRLLRGEPGHVTGATAAAPSATKAGVIDLAPETREVTAPRRAAPTMNAVTTGMGNLPGGGMTPAAQATMPEALRSFLERFQGSGLEAGLGGLTGLATPTPPTSCRMVPGSSVAPTATRPAAVPTSSTCPAPITARPCRWWSCCTAAPSRPTTSPPARGMNLLAEEHGCLVAYPAQSCLGQHLQVLELVQGRGPAA